MSAQWADYLYSRWLLELASCLTFFFSNKQIIHQLEEIFIFQTFCSAIFKICIFKNKILQLLCWHNKPQEVWSWVCHNFLLGSFGEAISCNQNLATCVSKSLINPNQARHFWHYPHSFCYFLLLCVWFSAFQHLDLRMMWFVTVVHLNKSPGLISVLKDGLWCVNKLHLDVYLVFFLNVSFLFF